MCDLIPIPNEFDDANDFWPHPIYNNYESNRFGVVRNVYKQKDVGDITKQGYHKISVNINGKIKRFYKHRFIYECFFGVITDDKLVIDHKNNIKTDNRLDNLQLLTNSQNVKKDIGIRENKAPIRIRATNIETGNSTDYDSISKCGRDLDINTGLICKVLKGFQNTSESKKDKNKYKFEKLNCKTEQINPPIKIRATNINTSESFDYCSIGECSKMLDIHRPSIRRVLNGIQKTATCKLDKNEYKFEKID